MTAQILAPLSSQWQLAFLALTVVMGALIWRAHRQVSALGRTSERMREHLVKLERMVEEIGGRATNTEHTLIANLAEYRMALGSVSQYRQYLQQLGVAPAGDVEPILEAVPDGALAVSREGKVLYANRTFIETTGIVPGMTLDEVVEACDVRTLRGDALDVPDMPMQQVLRGDSVRQVLLRLRPRDTYEDVILSVNGSPAMDVFGRVVVAVMVARQISEDVALAIEVRQATERRGAEVGELAAR